MHFLATYQVHDDEGRVHDVPFPVQGDSAEQVQSLFRQRMLEALKLGRAGFSFAGCYHHLETFVDSASRPAFEQLLGRSKQRGEHLEAIFDNVGDDDQKVFYIHYVLTVDTPEGLLQQARLVNRSLRWMSPLKDTVFLFDELWDRDILLPATRTDKGMAVLVEGGEPVVMKPEWTFWIRGHQDDLLIKAGPYLLQVLEGEEGYSVISATRPEATKLIDTPPEPEAAPFKHYLRLFNRRKVFLREKVIESPVQLTTKALDDLYDRMHEDLADEVWPAKIGWIDWSTTSWDTQAQ
jgi:hypothetical protein